MKVPSPFPKKIRTESALTTARSAMPSPLKSPVATDCGVLTVFRLGVDVKVPSPTPMRIVTVLLSTLVKARSGMPSPLKSATTIESG